jgi:hypothetical protein
MGILLGGSTVENEDRIEALEDELEKAQDDARRAANVADSVRRKTERVEEEFEEFAEAMYNRFNIETDDVAELEDKNGEVIRLEEERVAWKATRNAIVKLLLPPTAKVVYPNGTHVGRKKLRTNMAFVADMYDPDEFANKEREFMSDAENASGVFEDVSRHDVDFEYELGDLIQPEDELDDDVGVQCTSGIHLYRTKEGAIDHYEL